MISRVFSGDTRPPRKWNDCILIILIIDASPAALFHGHYNAANVSAEIVAIVQPFDATVARVVLSVDHHRSHNNNQQQWSDWNQFHFLKRLADWFLKR
jgi:hypothetical protein